jgi:hypothetical protein
VADALPAGTRVDYRTGQQVRVAVPGTGEVVVRADVREKDKLTWLTVRAVHPPGKPVVARLTVATPHEAKHAYFRAANGYEATFGPFKPKELSGSSVQLELVPVGPLLADPKAAIELPLPKPQAGRPPDHGHRIPVQRVKDR